MYVCMYVFIYLFLLKYLQKTDILTEKFINQKGIGQLSQIKHIHATTTQVKKQSRNSTPGHLLPITTQPLLPRLTTTQLTQPQVSFPGSSLTECTCYFHAVANSSLICHELSFDDLTKDGGEVGKVQAKTEDRTESYLLHKILSVKTMVSFPAGI